MSTYRVMNNSNEVKPPEYFILNPFEFKHSLQCLLNNRYTEAIVSRSIKDWFIKVYYKHVIRNFRHYAGLVRSWTVDPYNERNSDSARIEVNFSYIVLNTTVEKIELLYHSQVMQFPGRHGQKSKQGRIRLELESFEFKALVDGSVYPMFLDVEGCPEISELLDYFNHDEKAIPKDITRLSVPQALEASKKWHEEQDKRRQIDAKKLEEVMVKIDKQVQELCGLESLTPEDTYSIDIELLARKDNWNLFILKSEKALLNEGCKMHHCVHSYWPYVRLGDRAILSLINGIRRYTIEVHRKSNICALPPLKILQMRGVCNSSPQQEAVAVIDELLLRTEVHERITQVIERNFIIANPTVYLDRDVRKRIMEYKP